jgi:hypothetical protein
LIFAFKHSLVLPYFLSLSFQGRPLKVAEVRGQEGTLVQHQPMFESVTAAAPLAAAPQAIVVQNPPPQSMDGINGERHATSSARQQVMANLAASAGMTMEVATATPAQAAAMAAPQVTSMCFLFRNMFDAAEAAAGDDNFDLNLKEDVEDECEKFAAEGRVKHIFVDKQEALVYLRFDALPAALRAQSDFHGRWFAGRQLAVEFVALEKYLAMHPADNV